MMKSIKLMMVISCCLTGELGNTQSYVHFPDSVAVWHETYIQQIPPPILWYDAIGETYYKGDTTFNNLTYHKLFRTNRNIFCSQIIQGAYYVGALREDTIQQRIYVREYWQDTEHILYDFSLEVGDTLPDITELTVTSIDTIITSDGIARRRWHVPYYYYEAYYIEGIGGNLGLLSGVIGVEYPNVTMCFEGDEKQTVYINEYFGYGYGYCHVPTDSCWNVGIREDNCYGDFSIYPNPVYSHELFTLVMSKSKQEQIKTIDLYDIQGSEHSQIISPVFPIAIKSPEKQGLYFLRISYMDGNQYTIKLIVNK